MIETCMSSIYLSLFLWVLLSKILLYVAIRNSKGEIEMLLTISTLFDVALLFSLPLMLLMFQGSCI